MGLALGDHVGSGEGSNLSPSTSTHHGILAPSLSLHASHPLAQMDTFVIATYGEINIFAAEF